MPVYKVIYDFLRIRRGPSVTDECVGYYYYGDRINSGGYPFESEGRMWVQYYGASTGVRLYVCHTDRDGTRYLEEV